MLNNGVLSFDATGRVRTTASLPTDFNGGTPVNQGLLSFANGVPNRFVGGLGYLPDGALAATIVGDPVYFVGGVGTDDVGMVIMDAGNPIVRYTNGLPFTAEGKLAISAPEPPPTGRAFSDGFDSGFN
jgi:hypothetical protein